MRIPMGRRASAIRLAACLAVSSFLLSGAAWAVPMWARRYDVTCSFCHRYPSLQLTSRGLGFLRRGHRMAGDTLDKNFSHLVSAHLEWEYSAVQHESTSFGSPELHAHAGGAVSPLFSVYIDDNPSDELEAANVQVTKSLAGDQYVTVRAGKISPTIVRNYGNGLTASASTPLVLTDSALADNPFTPARDSYGVDAAYHLKGLFIQAGVLNGEDVPGQASVGNHKDVFASAELEVPDTLNGGGLYYYRGGYDLGSAATGFLFDQYDRAAAFGNYSNDVIRVAGAFLWGRDRVATLAADRKIHGGYVQIDGHPLDWLVPFGRYDDVKTETEAGDDRTREGTLGCAFRLAENEMTGGRVVVEAFREKDADVSATGALVNLMWAF